MEVWKGERGIVKAWVEGVPVEDGAREQMLRVAGLPFVFHHVAAMPDVHVGLGATIGSVIPTIGAVIPAAVGVDIGCGCSAQRLSLTKKQLPDLAELRAAIERAVPHGRTCDGGAGDRGAWGNVPGAVGAYWHTFLEGQYERIVDAFPPARHRRPVEQLGTLGTGNHFVEVSVDEQDRAWIVLHSGSRGPGNRLASAFISRAKELMGRWFVELDDADLAYLPEGTPEFGRYVQAAAWAQKYAKLNRELMMAAVQGVLFDEFKLDFSVEQSIDCHHNFLAEERHFGKNVWITRKGATRAGEGELGIIPGSMGARSYVVRGLGNRDSFLSCSHGAGRAMSRRRARERFSLEDHARATEGVECRKDVDVLDETPGAYKSIEAVMAAQRDLVSVLHELRQVVCVKG